MGNRYSTMSTNETITNATVPTVPTVVDDAIRAEARRRLETAEVERLAAMRLVADKERKKSAAIEQNILEQQLRLRIEEEKLRLMAQRVAAEAEAKRLEKEREDAIAAEMQRLKNRTEVEVLHDTVADLQAQIAELKTSIASSYRQ